MVDLDRFIDGLTSVDRDNLLRLLAVMKPVMLALEQEGAGVYTDNLFTNLIEGVVVESERRTFNALIDNKT